jgi:hypothetical protein
LILIEKNKIINLFLVDVGYIYIGIYTYKGKQKSEVCYGSKFKNKKVTPKLLKNTLCSLNFPQTLYGITCYPHKRTIIQTAQL